MSDRPTTMTMRDPFLGRDVVISDDLLDRLRGRYSKGPIGPDGEPEFGWEQYPQVPIQLQAADRIERLEAAFAVLAGLLAKAVAATAADREDMEVVLRLPTVEDADALSRALSTVASGHGATLAPEAKVAAGSRPPH